MWCHQYAQLLLRNNGKEKELSPLTAELTKLWAQRPPHHNTSLPFLSQWNRVFRIDQLPHEREINGNLGNSPLVYKNELAVNGAAGHELSGLDVDVFGRLVGHVREEAAHRHQAGQVWGFLLSVTIWVQLAARPTAHVSSAVEGTVSVCVCGHENKKKKLVHLSGLLISPALCQ